MSNIKEEPEEEPTGKKSKRGRRRFREISRINMTVRLLNGDKIHVEKMVRELKYKDPNFATESAAVRHYVHLGVIAETATTDLRGSLTNNIVKRSQKDAVRAELLPLDNKVENLVNAFKEFSEENSNLFKDVSRRTEVIETKLDAGNEAILGLLKSMNITGEQSFRNLIVLRSIIYVFFLGHKTGRIEPGKENLQKWHQMINLAHQKANALSLNEIKMLTGDVMEADVIRKMASEIFKEVLRLPQPANESQLQTRESTLIL
jgi:hypothetical protein